MIRPYIIFARHSVTTISLRAGTFRAIGPAQAIAAYLKVATRAGECPMEVTALPLQTTV